MLASACRLALGLAIVAATLTVGATRATAQPSDRLTVIEAGEVITVSGESFRPGVIVIQGQRIRAVGAQIDTPRSARVIEAHDQTVMPALVDPRTRYGLRNYRRRGESAGERATREVRYRDIDWSRFAAAGYATVAYIPAGTGVPGQASVYTTAGPDRAKPNDDAGYVRLTMTQPQREKRALRALIERAKKAVADRKKAKEDWQAKQKAAEEKAGKKEAGEKKDAEQKEKQQENGKDGDAKNASSAKFEPPAVDRHLLPFVRALEAPKDQTTVRFLVELSRASDLLHFDEVIDAELGWNVSYLLAAGGRRARSYRDIISRLGERKARILMEPTQQNLPYTNQPYALARELIAAGCTVALTPIADLDIEFDRVRARSADLVRDGLDRRAVFAALTIEPARLLGLDRELGSIERGKLANLAFFDGDPLRPDSRCQRLMVAGELQWQREE